MKQIKLVGKNAKDAFVLVNDEDYEELSKYEWRLSSNKKGVSYAVRTVTMHGQIMQNKAPFVVDHIDGNGLNNQRENLRSATISQNNANRSKRKKPSSSKYLGVYKTTYKNKYVYYRAMTKKDGKKHISPNFKTEEEAALWYNNKAKELHGEFAKLNIIDNGSNFSV